MSETVIFSIGAVIFAITVYGSVMAGGIALTRIETEENDAADDPVDLVSEAPGPADAQPEP